MQQPPQYGTYQPYPGGPTQNLPGQPNYPPDGGIPPKGPVGIGEIPPDNAEDSGPAPSAPPPVQDMDRIEGYQNFVGPNANFVPPPPSYAETVNMPSSAPEQFRQGVEITQEEARQCLVQHAESQCCWGKSAAENLTFNSVQSSTAVHYILKTYQETRSTEWDSVPYQGQPIDGPENGIPPGPWDIQIQTPSWFHDKVFHAEVPHTASVKICHTCHGAAMVMCYSCHGWGCRRCTSCSGSGYTGMHDNRRMCTWCGGSGRRSCFSCHGSGRVRCQTCEATGRVKYYIKLTVEFKTHTKDFILERTDLPDHLIRNVTGTTLIEDTQPCLYPIRSFPEPEVNRQSESLIQQHSQLARSGRVWMQNHMIRGVPVFQCNCTYKNKSLQYFVYGNDRKVHAPDYPQKCCWGCQVL